MEYHQNDDAPVALMEMRFHVPTDKTTDVVDPDKEDPVEVQFMTIVLVHLIKRYMLLLLHHIVMQSVVSFSVASLNKYTPTAVVIDNPLPRKPLSSSYVPDWPLPPRLYIRSEREMALQARMTGTCRLT